MVHADQPTLRTVFGWERDDGQGIGSLVREPGDALRELRSKLGDDIAPGVWLAVQDRIGTTIAEACEVPLTTVLAEGWKKYRPLREYCDPVKHPPEETSTVALSTHTVRSVQHPTVEFLVGERSVFTLKLDASVTVELDNAVLTIAGARFRTLTTGKSRVMASLAYKGIRIAERKSGQYKLPGTISFGAGIPICPGTAVAFDLPSQIAPAR